MTRALEPKDMVDWFVEGEAAVLPALRREGGMLLLRRWLFCVYGDTIGSRTMVDQLGNKKDIPGQGGCVKSLASGGGDVIVGLRVAPATVLADTLPLPYFGVNRVMGMLAGFDLQ